MQCKRAGYVKASLSPPFNPYTTSYVCLAVDKIEKARMTAAHVSKIVNSKNEEFYCNWALIAPFYIKTF